MTRNFHCMTGCLAALIAFAGAGCQKPAAWNATGPRVYLIQGDEIDESDGLATVAGELEASGVNARVYTPSNWLSIIRDIDAAPGEKAILVGHGHGGFLATQVVRHYADPCHPRRIDALFVIDAFNKDWPHTSREAGFREPHCRPSPIPVGHNALRVRNFVQSNPDSRRWGSLLVSTRATNLADEHPFFWYENWWIRRDVTGQLLGEELTDEGVMHDTIDDRPDVVARIVRMCREAALSPYHYTPPDVHPLVEPKTEPGPRQAMEKTDA